MVNLMDKVDVSPDLPARGPFPVANAIGTRTTIAMVVKSLSLGCYQTHQQFETIRKLHAGFANMYMSSTSGAFSLWTMGGTKSSTVSQTTQHNPCGLSESAGGAWPRWDKRYARLGHPSGGDACPSE
jgi:hypothetical protein